MVLRVAVLEGNEDHDATWLLGHVQRIDFKRLFVDDGELWAEARIHVPCRYLKEDEFGTAKCGAHGFVGKVPAPTRPEQPRLLGGDLFRTVDRRRMVNRKLPMAPQPRRSLPVAQAPNPCATAACRTADQKRGAACCRDLQVEIRCNENEELFESLIRSRRSPYLCKVQREDDDAEMINVEIISACGYLLEDRLSCGLHGRVRPDGRPAKPLLCSAWPKKRTGLHPGCAFANRRIPL